MVKNSVDLSEWTQLVNKANSTVSGGISKMKNVNFSQTNAKPFKEFTTMITNINSSLDSYKIFVKGSMDKMTAAGKNKANDDKAGAASLKIRR
ncbi:hypothetical protein QRK71_000533 [Enterococcus faecium]|uniref:hypothetical protein n=1 Tax=Enterococcus TaxID=1350 RepID=UPI00115BB963|nr:MULTISPECIES: hypothetical protein [Enterococcus]MBR3380369.1 hypothetical protein [Bacillus sp. (in: firmicutes)]EGP4764925.1 hypothetical protein [Enterococcus faecium]EME3563169.1 hypothetical protein [Enterococcus faecium]EME7135289.1 hypothetical protein [Enterococcus faecium]EMF0400848.1 hypothetical protein [Enterococcus faecium]